MRRLRYGLIDPNKVPKDDLNDYMATTYSGYMAEVQNRLWELHQALDGTSFVSQTFQKEVWAIQLRICIELLCFAVVDFDQVNNGVLGTSQRSTIDLDKILKKRKENSNWPVSFPSDWNTSFEELASGRAPLCHYPNLNSVSETTNLKGRLDNIVHGERRPRKEKNGHLNFKDIYQVFVNLKAFSERQAIVGDNGEGWLLDAREEYQKATGASTNKVKVWHLTKSED